MHVMHVLRHEMQRYIRSKPVEVCFKARNTTIESFTGGLAPLSQILVDLGGECGWEGIGPRPRPRGDGTARGAVGHPRRGWASASGTGPRAIPRLLRQGLVTRATPHALPAACLGLGGDVSLGRRSGFRPRTR
jgi:hypothetical protein